MRKRAPAGGGPRADGRDQALALQDGREVGFVDYGRSEDTAVMWCHGGPGSRLEPAQLAPNAVAAGLRIIGVDRPGYGLSTPQPGRTIGGWVSDALAVADHLVIDRFVTVGVSTGGAYALAAAALAPDRVIGVVACCSMTDMRCAQCRSTMSKAHVLAVWDAGDREAALAAAVAAHGEDGSRMGDIVTVVCPSDLALFRDARWMAGQMAAMPAMFAHGLVGYTDDRLADGCGWVSFDVGAITCPVTVLHGGSDALVDVAHAHHTAGLIPHARLRVFEALGHFTSSTR